MRITLTSVLVDDQEKALRFYTEKLGFVKKMEIPAAQTGQRALFDTGIPLTSFAVTDTQLEYERPEALGVAFRMKPTPMGPTIIARFEDTCGNLIQIHQA